MHYSELIQLYFERSSALQWYWTLYVVIAGGLLAFSSLRVRRDAVTEILVTVLFIIFAYKNMGAIEDTTIQRLGVLQAIHQYAGPDATEAKHVGEFLEPTLIETHPEGIRHFHMLSDLLVIAALWGMELRRIRAARNDPPKPQ